MQKINDEEGDAFPYEKARVIAEMELTMKFLEYDIPRLFPKWLHVMIPKGASTRESGVWHGTVQAIRSENQALVRKSHKAVEKLCQGVIEEMKGLEVRMEEEVRDNKSDIQLALREVQTAMQDEMRSQMEALHQAMTRTRYLEGHVQDDSQL
eukprot:m.287751 g.287751  ORF g.287751 m.287751 type:complete len:152 (+) comp167200_c0_seq1:112-567(+)